MVSITFCILCIESLAFAFKAVYSIFVLLFDFGQYSMFHLYVWSDDGVKFTFFIDKDR